MSKGGGGSAGYTGILLIDKPAGFTSFDVVAKLRGIARMKKIGHAGTLDPMATGVLPLFFGRATKACELLPRQDKTYLAEFRLGIATDTQDITGRVLRERPVEVEPAQVISAAQAFLGAGMQLPPMYSAVKQGGRKLYELARQGLEVERTPRPILIHALRCEAVDPAQQLYRMEVHCSKGTYIRTLAADLGERLGCGAALTALRRTMAVGFSLSECVTLEQVQALAEEGRFETALRPLAEAFVSLPRAELTELQGRMYRNGVRLDAGRIQLEAGDGPFSVWLGHIFLGIARVEDGNFIMTKLFTLEE